MKLLLLAALMITMTVPPLVHAVSPSCQTVSENTAFFGVTETNCAVSGYVCVEPRYFGGGGGKVPLVSNWVCYDEAAFSLP